MGQICSSSEEGSKTLPQKMSDALLRHVPVVPKGGEEEQIDYATSGDFKKAESHLRPESDLSDKLFGWPDDDFSEANSVHGKWHTEPVKQKTAGDWAIDFTLPAAAAASAPDGVASETPPRFFSLSALLREKPVMVCSVALTCPHCMAWSAAMDEFAKEYAENFHFVAVAVMQPHPEKPAKSFETGKVWEFIYTKGVPQERTLAERLTSASTIKKELPHWTVVADDLDARVNPFWSTYGPAPRCAYLIHTNGLICHSMLWWEPTRATKAVKAYLA